MGFKPLADDTELDVEARQVAAWRSMSAAQKALAVTAKRIDVTLDLERAIAESAD